MALIHCPECGKEISDQAPHCIHCGYPLSTPKSVGRSAKRIEKSPLARNSIAPRKVLLIAGAVLMAVVLVVGCLLQFRGPSVRLPYGVAPNMSSGEMTRQMEDHGLRFDHEWLSGQYQTYFFESSYVYGFKTGFTSLDRTLDGTRVSVGHFFEEDAAYGRSNPSPQFSALREKLISEYGQPSHEIEGLCTWEDGAYELRLDYTDMTGGALWIEYAYER